MKLKWLVLLLACYCTSRQQTADDYLDALLAKQMAKPSDEEQELERQVSNIKEEIFQIKSEMELRKMRDE